MGKSNFKEIVSTFETMSAKKAAPIITRMKDDEAITILSSLKPDTFQLHIGKYEAERCGKVYHIN